MLPFMPSLWLCFLIASSLTLASAQSGSSGSVSENESPIPSTLAAFLSPGSTTEDDSCTGSNGETGVLRKRALSAFSGAPQRRNTEPDTYCSIEQRLTQNQILPAATTIPQGLRTIAAQASGDDFSTNNGQSAPGISSDREVSSPPATSILPTTSILPATSSPSTASVSQSSATAFDPNDVAPAQMSQLLSDLKPVHSTQISPTSNIDLESSGIPGSTSLAAGAAKASLSVPISSASTPIGLILSKGSTSSVDSPALGSGSPSEIITRVGTTTTSGIAVPSASGTSKPATEEASVGSSAEGVSQTNKAAPTGGETSLNGSSSPIPPGLAPAGSSPSPAGSGGDSGIASAQASAGTGSAPLAFPTGLLPPGHQLPPGGFSFGNGSSGNGSSTNVTSALPFTGQAIRLWDLACGWRCIITASTALAYLAGRFI